MNKSRNQLEKVTSRQELSNKVKLEDTQSLDHGVLAAPLQPLASRDLFSPEQVTQMESGDNQPLQTHVARTVGRVRFARTHSLRGGWRGQCMFVLLFAHFFHYFISFRPPPTRPRSRLCASAFL